jgi:hypothetical protein
MTGQDGTAAGGAAAGGQVPATQAAAELDRLCADYFTLVHTLDPFSATQLGVSGFDALVPDPSREGAARGAGQIAAIEQRLAAIDTGQLDQAGQTNAAVLGHLARVTRSDLEQGLWEAGTWRPRPCCCSPCPPRCWTARPRWTVTCSGCATCPASWTR